MTDADAPAVPPADDKDWTWVLERSCPECGFTAEALPREALPQAVAAAASRWQDVLTSGDPALTRRPAPAVWSPAEYGCHVRDVLIRFAARLRAIRTEDDPVFENWDQDATALADRYWEQDPAVVAAQVADAAATMGPLLTEDGSPLDDAVWARPGRRSNGSVFTAESLTRYMIHDLVHHLHDVGAPASASPR